MKNRLLKDTLIYGGGDFLFKFISFAVFPLYAYTFSLTEFGIIELISTTVMFFSGFYSLGLNFSTARLYWDSDDLAYQKKLISTGFWGTMIGSAGFSGLIFLFLYAFRDLVFKATLIDWRLFAIAFLGNIASVGIQYVRDVFRVRFEPIKYLILSACENILKMSLALGMIYIMTMGLSGYFWGIFVGSWISLGIGIVLISSQIGFAINGDILKKSISYGMPVVFGGVATWIYSVSDRWLLAELSSNEEVGLYAIAFKFASLLFFVYIAFGMAFFPYAMKHSQEDSNFRAAVPNMFTNWMSLTLIVCLGISIFASELLFFTTPEKYWKANSLVMFTTVGYWIFCSVQFSSLGIHISKKTRLFVPIAWGVAIVNILLNILFIPFLGATGSALATLIANTILTGLYFYFSHKLQPYCFNVYQAALLCVIMAFCGICIYMVNQIPVSIALWAVKVLAFSCILVLMMWLKLINVTAITQLLKSFSNPKTVNEG